MLTLYLSYPIGCIAEFMLRNPDNIAARTTRKRLFPKGPRHHREAFRPMAPGVSSPEAGRRVRSECVDSGMASWWLWSPGFGEELKLASCVCFYPIKHADHDIEGESTDPAH